jgi:PhoH-like ATPase
MQGIYVLDTNVLIHDPRAVFAFSNSVVVVPLTVTEELDRLKGREGIVGKNARLAARVLDELTRGLKGSAMVELENRSTLVFATLPPDSQEGLPKELAEDKPDNKILAVAIAYNSIEKNQDKVTLVSNDVNLRVKARLSGLLAEEYETSQVDISELYTGIIELEVSSEEMSRLFKNNELSLQHQFFPNQAVILSEAGNPGHTGLAIAKRAGGILTPVRQDKTVVSQIRPRNREQQLALKLLLDENIDLVTLVGKAGTGKTLLALAAALHQVNLNGEGPYNKIIVSRPIMPMGKDPGTLPGNIEDKLRPWTQPILDNLSIVAGTCVDGKSGTKWQSQDTAEMLTRKGILEVEALAYIRGRSIPNVILIVDEAQNLHPHEIKTILTRAGEGTKVILTGDIDQIDNPYLDAVSNGLTHAVERAKTYQRAGHITMTKGERSLLADWASHAL